MKISRVFTTSQAEHKPQFTLNTEKGNVHFFLEWRCEGLYTQEEINECKGRKNCYNCNCPIQGPLFFYPVMLSKLEVFACDPSPHCSKACARRSVIDLPMHDNLSMLFAIMYGDVLPAPPRKLLYLGVSLKEYHQMVKDDVVMQLESESVRSFIAPVYVSASFMKDYKMSDGAMAYMAPKTSDVDVPRAQEACGGQQTVYTLPIADPAEKLFR